MAIIDDGRHSRFRRSEQREASFLFLLAYPFCLAAAVAARFGSRGLPVAPVRRKSVFSEARSSARSIIPFAFR